MSYILLISKGEPEHSYNQIKTKPKFNRIKSAVLIIQDPPPPHTHTRPFSSGLPRAHDPSPVPALAALIVRLMGLGQLHSKVARSLAILPWYWHSTVLGSLLQVSCTFSDSLP